VARFKPQKKRAPQVRGQQSKRNAAVPSEPVTVVIDSLNHDGQGVSRSRDKVLFVEGALPGETVDVQITQAQRSFDVGQIKQVISPSSERVEPPCEH